MSEDKFQITIAVFLVLKRGEEILLHKRINTRHENGNYGMVSGHLDGNETVQGGIAREAKEEAGIVIAPEKLKVIHVMHNKAAPPYGEYLNVFLTTSVWEGEPKNMEPDRCSDLAWFPVHQLPQNTISYVRVALQYIDGGIFYSNFGW